jgi:hypothetical protein
MSIDFKTCVATKSGNIRSPKGRLSYVFLENPNPNAKVTSGNNAGKCKYTLSLLLPPDSDLTLLKDAANKVAIEEFGLEKLKALVEADKFNSPFLDAFKKSKTEKNPAGDEWMKGWTLIRLDSLTKPQVVEANGKLIGDDYSGVYAGRWAFVTMNPAAYPAIDGGKPGVKFYLGNVQLLDHDERLGGGRPAAEDEFAPVPGVAEGKAPSTDSVFGGGEQAVSVL